MHVLITGGAGFIGSHLVEYHVARGDQVLVVDDLSTGNLDNIAPWIADGRCRFEQADILVWPELYQAVAWADRIYHLAAIVGVFRVLEDPIRVLSVNVAGCERVLRAVHAGGWNPEVVVASSSEVYGSPEHGNFREDAELVMRSGAQSRWNYAISKLADEALGLSYARKYGLRVSLVRFFNTIGPRQRGRYGMVVPRFVRQAVHGEPITIFGDGSQTRSFCDVRDTVAMLDRIAGDAASAGQIINVGNDREISIAELAALVRTRAESHSELRFIPYDEAYGEAFEDMARRRPDLSKVRALTGYQHRWTLEQTLDDLIQRSAGASAPAPAPEQLKTA